MLDSSPKSNLYLQPSRPQRGVAQRHQREAGCGGRVGANRRMAPARTAKSCGPDTPTLVSSRRSYPLAMVARKPGHQGEREISRKTIARGMPGDSGVTVVTVTGKACFFCPARLRARWAPGIPCALTFEAKDFLHNPGEIAPRECGD